MHYEASQIRSVLYGIAMDVVLRIRAAKAKPPVIECAEQKKTG